MDRLFHKSYRNWLHGHCDLYDWSCRPERHPSRALEYFRTHPQDWKWQDRIRNNWWSLQREPSFKAIQEHRELRGADTIWCVNSFTKRPRPQLLLMLVDSDAHKGELDAHQLAQFVSGEFFGGQQYIEPSRNGLGRHGYFLLDCEFLYPAQVNPIIKSLTARIKEATIGKFEASVDAIFGMPTIWRGDEIEYRGNKLKLPYLPGGEVDFAQLRNLTPIPISDFMPNKEASQVIPTPQPLVCCPSSLVIYLSGTTPPPTTQGWRKKCLLVSQTLHKNGGKTPDLQTLYEEYMTTCQPTIMAGDTKRRYSELERVISHMVSTFEHQKKVATFDPDKYLTLVTDLVPPLAFHWQRGEKIDHRRLADFVAVKVQDAFVVKAPDLFGRTARDTTIKNFKSLRAKGLVDWVPTGHIYAKLLDIAKTYKLLYVFDEYTPPNTGWTGTKIVKVKGRARLIGPGEALTAEREAFDRIFREVRPTIEQQQEKIA